MMRRDTSAIIHICYVTTKDTNNIKRSDICTYDFLYFKKLVILCLIQLMFYTEVEDFAIKDTEALKLLKISFLWPKILVKN